MSTNQAYDRTKYIEANDRLTNMTDLDRCMDKANAKGYVDQFQAVDKGLRCIENEKIYQPEDVKVPNYFRFEGISDPEDMSILYEIETNDGRKGTLVDAYGPYADPGVGMFMIAVEDIHKKAPKTGVELKKVD